MRRRFGVAHVLRDAGCWGGLGIAVLILAVLYWLVVAVVALFSTPVPYVLMALAGAVYGGVVLRRQRIRKLFFDTVALIHGMEGPDPSAPEALWRHAAAEPDVRLLRAAYLASSGRHGEAAQLLRAIPLDSKHFGRISGPLTLWFPGFIEALWFGNGAHVPHNVALACAYESALAGDPSAERPLQQRLHEPQHAAAVGALAEAYAAHGRYELAVRTIGNHIDRVGDAERAAALRYKWASYLAAAGNAEQAARMFAELGDYRDASQQVEGLAQRVAVERARAEAERQQRRKERAEAQRRQEEKRQQRLEEQAEAQRRQEAKRQQRLEEQAQARRRQEAERQQRLEEQARARRRRVETEDQEVLAEALDRISDARGPRTRERALEWGLERIQQPQVREELRLQASRLDVEAVLDKVAGLKTKAAKRRNLEAALDRLRDDDVPDRHQAAEIAAIERALDALEGNG